MKKQSLSQLVASYARFIVYMKSKISNKPSHDSEITDYTGYFSAVLVCERMIRVHSLSLINMLIKLTIYLITKLITEIFINIYYLTNYPYWYSYFNLIYFSIIILSIPSLSTF